MRLEHKQLKLFGQPLLHQLPELSGDNAQNEYRDNTFAREIEIEGASEVEKLRGKEI